MWDLADVAARLDRLRALDRDCQVFGAEEEDGHGYRSAPMSLAAVEEFEQWMTVPLPQGIREFLLTIGEGAGPYYGIKLSKSDPDHPQPGGDFPFTEQDAEQSYRTWRDWLRDPKGNNSGSALTLPSSSVPGCVAIAEQGCGAFTALVTTGELRGRLWDSGYGLWYPAHSPPTLGNPEPAYLGPTPTFEDWYDAWLTEALSTLDK